MAQEDEGEVLHVIPKGEGPLPFCSLPLCSDCPGYTVPVPIFAGQFLGDLEATLAGPKDVERSRGL